MARVRVVAVVLLAVVLLAWCASSVLWAQGVARSDTPPAVRDTGEAQWIWAAGASGTARPATAFFRRAFLIRNPVYGQVEITCQDQYELYVNGRLVGSGKNWRVLDRHDITKYLVTGRNTLAVRAQSNSPNVAGLVARVTVRPAGGTFVSYSTDARWKCSTEEQPHWYWPTFNDSAWTAAHSLGELGRTPPWDDQVRPADGSSASRFQLPAGFEVERIVSPQAVGSLIGMTFDEWGDLVLSKEGAGLLLVRDDNKDGLPETVVPLCDQIRNAHGLLCVNGDVYAMAQGPDGAGLYRLQDADGDRKMDRVTLLMPIEGSMSEHGPHSLALGHDGMIYAVIGNHARLKLDPRTLPQDNSPYRHEYEGDLVQPRHEDAGGHAVGIKAPGGIVVRLALDGSGLQVVAGGLRNAYDLAFDEHGELFTYDSDMEWDEGLPWYRPTRVLHVVPGAEFGWRSGWAKWPDYYLDSLPPVVETGRGSPTGMVFYQHERYPRQYRGALFAADWTQGRILAITLQPAGASYRATTETFLEGKPLNATDLEVGPDGCLYFCTGGRGTEGGVYRIVYRHSAAATPRQTGVWRALRQPQLLSAPSREQIAAWQQEMGRQWDVQLTQAVNDARTTPADRVRALRLMHLYGPVPTAALLVRLSRDADATVRETTAVLMGLHGDDATRDRLIELLADAHPRVVRAACEALLRAGQMPPAERLLPLLAHNDRHTAWAASRLLRSLPQHEWQAEVLRAATPRVFHRGAAVLLAVDDDPATARAVLASARRIMAGFLDDNDFVDLLRVVELAMHRGNLRAEDLADWSEALRAEYPALTHVNPVGGHRINRELVRLLTYLQEPQAVPLLLAQLRADLPSEERMHVAAHLAGFKTGWTTEQKLEYLAFGEQARAVKGGYSLSRYCDNFLRSFVSTLTPEERGLVLHDAVRWPTAALWVLSELPPHPGHEVLEKLIATDQQLSGHHSEAARRLQTGIVAVLGRSGDPQAMAYLRQVFENDPERRATLAMGLAQSPGGENWPLLIRALPVLEGTAAEEVLRQLATVDRKPDKGEQVRQVILCGLRLGDAGGRHAVALLEKWFDQKIGQPDDPWEKTISQWQEAFAQSFPDEPPAVLPPETAGGKWKFEELLARLYDEETVGDPARGAAVFARAQCIKCHRFGTEGEGFGPDLTHVSRRFQKREVLESILFPSQVISDQYASKTIVTVDGRQFTGLVGVYGPDAYLVLQTNGEKLRIFKKDVEQVVPARKSAMPEGLLNDLTLQDIADLFAYLYSARDSRVARRPEGTAQP